MGRAAALKRDVETLGLPARRPAAGTSTKTMWHVTASRLRDQIVEHGVDSRRFRFPGYTKVKEHFNYLWSDYGAALAYVEWLRAEEPDGIDIWAVDANGLTLERDPYFDGSSGGLEYIGEDGEYAAWRSSKPLPPALLTLVEQNL